MEKTVDKIRFMETFKAEFYQAVEFLQHVSGLTLKKKNTLFGTNPEAAFVIRNLSEGRNTLLGQWSLVDQLSFLRNLSGLSPLEKTVQIYEKVYSQARIYYGDFEKMLPKRESFIKSINLN
jgi:hypothetical protein